jgi:hypothetical protein
VRYRDKGEVGVEKHACDKVCARQCGDCGKIQNEGKRVHKEPENGIRKNSSVSVEFYEKEPDD